MTEAHPFQVSEDLPREIGRGIVQIGPVAIEVIQLDNGQRLISPEGLAAMLQWLGHETGPIADAVKDEGDAAG